MSRMIWMRRALACATIALAAAPGPGQAQSVDHDAQEALRTNQMQVLDQLSRRMLRAGEDAAELMTPAQRTRFFNERLQHRGNY